MTEDQPDPVRAWAWSPEPPTGDGGGDIPAPEIPELEPEPGPEWDESTSIRHLTWPDGPTRAGQPYPGLVGLRTDAIPPSRPSWDEPAEPPAHDPAQVTGYPARRPEPVQADPPPASTDRVQPPTSVDPSETVDVPAAPSPPVLPPAPPATFSGAAYPPMTDDEATRGHREHNYPGLHPADQADRNRGHGAEYAPGHSAPARSPDGPASPSGPAPALGTGSPTTTAPEETAYPTTQYPPAPQPRHQPPPQPPVIPARLPRPEALLLPDAPAVSEEPAQWGWRGRMRRLSGGLIKPRPTPAELSARRALVDIRRTFSRPMTVVVIQPKGGAGKTPTTIGLASALGAHRGGYVVGWDDNETRGTLAVRVSNPSGQKMTVWDLLGALPMFERTDARVGDLSHFVRPQGEAQFDALVSDDNPANMAQIGEDEFHRLHAVLQRFYRQIVIDTGNNVRSPNWQAAVNAADLVVVVSTYQRDVGYSGSWVLDHLTETGREPLARGAVTVLTAADPTPDARVRSELLEHFTARTAAVVEIPHDPLIAVGGPMDWSKLQPQTRRAWTSAGAAVVSALAAKDERDRMAHR